MLTALEWAKEAMLDRLSELMAVEAIAERGARAPIEAGPLAEARRLINGMRQAGDLAAAAWRLPAKTARDRAKIALETEASAKLPD